MIKRGTKKRVLAVKESASCPTCGAVGSLPCISQGNGKPMKNTHKERLV